MFRANFQRSDRNVGSRGQNRCLLRYVALVEAKNFTSRDFGEPSRRPGDKWAFWYFRPYPMPRELALDAETVYALSEADNALGLLQGLGKLIRAAGWALPN